MEFLQGCLCKRRAATCQKSLKMSDWMSILIAIVLGTLGLVIMGMLGINAFWKLYDVDVFLKPRSYHSLWPPTTLPGHLESLINSPDSTLKLLSRHVFHAVHMVHLPISKQMRIRAVRWAASPPGFMRYAHPKMNFQFALHLPILSTGSKNLKSCEKSFLQKASRGLHLYLATRSKSHLETIESVTGFIRALGFFYDSNGVYLNNLDWNNPDLIQDLINAGHALPWQQFIVYWTIPLRHQSVVHVRLSCRGILKQIKQEASVGMDKFWLTSHHQFMAYVHWIGNAFMSQWLDTMAEDELDEVYDSDIPICRSRSQSEEGIFFFVCSCSRMESFTERIRDSAIQQQTDHCKGTLRGSSETQFFECAGTFIEHRLAQVSLAHPTLLLANAFRKKLKWNRGSNIIFDDFLLSITSSKMGIVSISDSHQPSHFTYSRMIKTFFSLLTRMPYIAIY